MSEKIVITNTVGEALKQGAGHLLAPFGVTP
jgi:hypothetical protein